MDFPGQTMETMEWSIFSPEDLLYQDQRNSARQVTNAEPPWQPTKACRSDNEIDETKIKMDTKNIKAECYKAQDI